METHENDTSSTSATPTKNSEQGTGSNTGTPDKNSRVIETLARFSNSWETPPLFSQSQEKASGESTFRNMLSSPAKQTGSERRISSNSRMEQEELLNVEKSRILEILRQTTTDVDQLESRLQALKRKRARTAASTVHKQQEMQEVEAQEMRQILGNVHQLSLIEESRKSSSKQSSQSTINTPLSSHTIPNVDVEMIRRLQSLTNIAFTSIEHHKLSALDSEEGRRQYHIKGLCFQLEFDVEFSVLDPKLDLSNIKIQIPRSALSELQDFIYRAQKESLLLPFFRTFSMYAQMDYDRQVVMTNLAKRFPKLLKSNKAFSNNLAIQGSKSSVKNTPLDIPPKIEPRTYLSLGRQADEKATLDAIPMQFARLLQLKGTEGAVSVLLQCVYGRQAPEEPVEEEEES
ncbi:hypothetical protein BGZ76_001150 [Entomortierella beljakovae]|nr:hypothetical protein BGZ76_001150 [Entomortierella beljakovae]